MLDDSLSRPQLASDHESGPRESRIRGAAERETDLLIKTGVVETWSKRLVGLCRTEFKIDCGKLYVLDPLIHFR